MKNKQLAFKKKGSTLIGDRFIGSVKDTLFEVVCINLIGSNLCYYPNTIDSNTLTANKFFYIYKKKNV